MGAMVASVGWPCGRLSEAVESLARTTRLAVDAGALPPPPVGVVSGSSDEAERWLVAAADRLGVEAEPLRAPYHEIEGMLLRGGPLIVRVASGDSPLYLLVLGGRRGKVRLLAPDLSVHRLPVGEVRAALCALDESRVSPRIDGLLEEAGLHGRRQARAGQALLREHLAGGLFGGCWLLRAPPSAPFVGQLRQAGLLGLIAVVGGCHLFQYLVMLGAWWLIGRGALVGRLDTGWLLGWALLLLTMVLLQLVALWFQGRFFIGAGGLLKQRLLSGVLRLDPEEVRHLGAGQFLSRIYESESLEALMLGGGYLALLAVVELGLALVVLALGAGGAMHVALLIAWVALVVLLAWQSWTARASWTESRLELTNDLVERMVGHRTRLAQQPPEQWHEGEDALLSSYLTASHQMDVLGPLVAAIPSGWGVIGVAGLAAPFVTGKASMAAVAVSLGGIILGSRALARFAEGLNGIAGAAIAWRRVAPILAAATRGRVRGALEGDGDGAAETVAEAHEVVFGYAGRPHTVLDCVDLKIRHGERALLLGPSGGGKSTLVSLLAGVRRPQTGLLLMRGLDMETLGEAQWRRYVAAAPQFHENHVLTGTFCFNLLMGRDWPPTHDDLSEAERICAELGLGELIARMPAGLMQMVGDTGWQLSHGERSRLYLARALLQGAQLVVLDESFAALDPHNLERAIACARTRAATLLVVAHP